jgi:hypothetical protein
MSNSHQLAQLLYPTFSWQKFRKTGEFQERMSPCSRPPVPLDRGPPPTDAEPDDLAIAFSAGGETRTTKRGAHNVLHDLTGALETDHMIDHFAQITAVACVVEAVAMRRADSGRIGIAVLAGVCGVSRGNRRAESLDGCKRRRSPYRRYSL